MAIKTPLLTEDDQEYYPLHEEDDVPETPVHEAAVRYARGALATRFPDWLVTGNVCIYWERGNTRKYRAPDLFMVKEPLTEPVTRVYQLWKQPPIAFALEVGSRTTFRQDVGPKVEIYEQWIKAAEYCHVDLDHQEKRFWRLGPNGYETVAPEASGRMRSQELGLEIDLVDGILRIFTPDGQMLPTQEETTQRLEETTQRLEETAQRLEETEDQRRAAEQQAAEEARQRQAAELRVSEAEDRAAALQRQLAELRARLGNGE